MSIFYTFSHEIPKKVGDLCRETRALMLGADISGMIERKSKEMYGWR
jgi:hypothetical protein